MAAWWSRSRANRASRFSNWSLTRRPPIYKTNEATGKEEKPWESMEILVPEEYVSGVMDLLNQRKGELQDIGLDEGKGMSIIKYLVPTRGMLGLQC